MCVGYVPEDTYVPGISTSSVILVRVVSRAISQLLTVSLTSILGHNAANLLGITQARDRRLSRPLAKPPRKNKRYNFERYNFGYNFGFGGKVEKFSTTATTGYTRDTSNYYRLIWSPLPRKPEPTSAFRGQHRISGRTRVWGYPQLTGTAHTRPSSFDPWLDRTVAIATTCCRLACWHGPDPVLVVSSSDTFYQSPSQSSTRERKRVGQAQRRHYYCYGVHILRLHGYCSAVRA